MPKKKTKLQELRERNPWKTKTSRKGRGRQQGAAGSRFNTPISAKLNKQRADSNTFATISTIEGAIKRPDEPEKNNGNQMDQQQSRP